MEEEVTDPNQLRLAAVDDVILAPLVQKALQRDGVKVVEWNYSQISGGTGGGLGGTFVYRFSGNALDSDKSLPWALILKIVRARPDEPENSTHYWKREFEAYRSGILNDMPGKLFAAKSFGVVEFPEEACWVWQEVVEDCVGATWEMEHYRLSARHIGYFNGAYLTMRAIPQETWLSTGWLRQIVEAAESHFPAMLELLNSPVLRPYMYVDTGTSLQKFWNERTRFLDALDRLPQTLCHQDPVRNNLFIRRGPDGTNETVAIDWAFVGCAPLGTDIAVALDINLLFLKVAPDQAKELSDSLYGGYLEGLREAGFAGDERLVRLGYCASATCKMVEALMLTKMYGLDDPTTALQWEGLMHNPYEDVLRATCNAFIFVFGLADEARALIEILEQK